MIVVADSGPLIALAKIGKLHVLHELFGTVVIPRAVWVEVVERGKRKPGSEEVRNAEWIEVVEVRDVLGVEILEREIEKGEAEAIVLARELNAPLLLLDEKIPGIIAKSLGLKVSGSLAVLFMAKKRGILNEDLDSLIRELRRKGVYFSDGVVKSLKEMYSKT
ncbi:DUF3368 domain-containing protein [Thermococcus thioreducens]|uniref:Nucleotide-binding protein n=1 Tax=Thermococcus thioreducens TaxID=277988 RepID=A0A0Q2QRM6_9EURY|nr:DUF3368 domain-containing protein [Thermococcus thioreducens]ASJ11616.1 nucleotide-binding protein [Thermococcus thioreducens]KQH82645.1 nucleotide-binding protein [Thermococcus thioreducens]SEW16849.1 Predicted nucleic acid-binding protein, contains PIN domain [Thermococcus thioreducens]